MSERSEKTSLLLQEYADYVLGLLDMIKRQVMSEDVDAGSLLAKLEWSNKTINEQQSRITELEKMVLKREIFQSEQRNMFYKELFLLKEQIFQNNRIGNAYEGEPFEVFNPQSWIDEILGETAANDIDSLKKQFKEKIDKLNETFDKKKKNLEDQIKVYYFIIFIFIKY